MSYWLIGVTMGELDRVARPAFLRTLANGFDEHGANPVASKVLRVTDPEKIYDLRSQWGEKYVHFYYLDGPAMEAAEDLELPLNRLQSTETAAGAELCAVVQLPQLYAREKSFARPEAGTVNRPPSRIKI